MTPDLLRLLVREVVEQVLSEGLNQGQADPLTVRRLPQGSPRGQHARANATRRIERGAVTERIVREAARDGVTLVLGPRAVLTPLARDCSRTLGVTVERRTDVEER